MNEQSKWGGLAAPLGGALVLAILAIPAWLALQNSAVEALPTALSVRQTSLQARWPVGTPAAEPVLAPPLPPASAAAEVAPDACGSSLAGEAVQTRSTGSESKAAEALRARDRLGAALLASPDAVSRAVGHVLRSLGEAEAPEDGAVCGGAGCPIPARDRAEAALARKQRRLAGAGQRDALARLALHTRSAPLYAIAWQTCHHDGEADSGSVCGMLSADQWALLEPDNAVPWLEVAAQAQQRGDGAALAEAMFRVSRARGVDNRMGQLAHILFKHLPPGTPPAPALSVAGDLSRLDTSWNQQRYQVPLAYCTVGRLADANHHQRCNEIAELFLSRGRALQELSLAAQLGERLGWSAARVDAITSQHDAMTQAMLQEGAGAADGSMGCVALRRKTERLREVAEKGERAAALMAMQRIGKTEADLTHQYRERRVRLSALSASAASAPGH